MAKRRLDTLLVDRGLAANREIAQSLVMAGAVSVGHRPAPTPAALVDEATPLQVADRSRYVSRGGDKLEHSLDAFGLNVSGFVAADIGASSGGFTDCLLQRGVSSVYAIDVGKGQLNYRLRNDARVVVMEGVNARELDTLPEPMDLIVIDVSFISLRLVLPTAQRLLSGNRLDKTPFASIASASRSIVALFKPQFEARKDEVPRGGVIRDPQLQARTIGRFVAWCARNRVRVLDLTASPVLGAKGNREFFFWLRPEVGTAPRDDAEPASYRSTGVSRPRVSSQAVRRKVTRG